MLIGHVSDEPALPWGLAQAESNLAMDYAGLNFLLYS
jgi:hypothetical protein